MKDGIKSYQKYHSEESINKLYKVDPVSMVHIAVHNSAFNSIVGHVVYKPPIMAVFLVSTVKGS